MPDRLWSSGFVFLLCILSLQTQQVNGAKDVVASLVLYPAVYMIDASWELVNVTGAVTRYHVSWTGTGVASHDCYIDSPSTTTNSSNCSSTVTLEICSLYEVTVQPQKKEAPSPVDTGTPGSASSYTLPAGDISISDVTCSAGNDLSATVKWSGPGGCVEYTVSYTATVLWGDQDSLHDSLTTRELSASFTDLVPYTRYSFTVQADGAPAVDACNTTTPEKEPSAPTDVTVSNTTATSVLVAWLEPDLANGKLLEYRVQWQSSEGDSGQKDTTQTSLVLDNLRACSNYSVTVAASTSEGFGDYSSPANFYTDAAVPPAVTNLAIVGESSRSVTLSWTRPDTDCAIVEYTAVYDGVTMWETERLLDNTSVSTSSISDNETLEMDLEGLIPYSNYSIIVIAATEAGDGDASETIGAQTEEDVPSAPLNLSIEVRNSSVAQVSWEPPEMENGIIISYTVRWTISNDTEAETTATVPSDEFSYDVPDLQECVPYVFSVSASTSAGEGEAASKEGGTADVSAPEVECSFDANSASVEWSSSNSYCNFSTYNVAYTIEVLWSGEKQVGSDTVESKTEYTPSVKEWYSTYTFEVSVTDGVSWAGPAGECSTNTSQAAPSEPQNLTLLDSSTSSLTIWWQQPLELNGILEYYIVSWSIEDSDGEKKNETVPTKGEINLDYTIYGLSSGKSYIVEVQGVTVEAGKAVTGTFPTHAAPEDPSSAAGIVVGCIFGILLLAVIIAAFIKRDYIREKYREFQERAAADQTSRPAEANSNNSLLLSGIRGTIEQFEDYPEKLNHAYEHLKQRSAAGPTTVAGQKHNVFKNRYYNILPYDRTRVKLLSRGPMGDYINANYVRDSSNKVRFIACQGPLDDTLEDFWEMIWQENVRIIVMLANCVEGNKQKCTMYWPQYRNAPMVVGQKYLTLEEERQEAHHIRRSLSLKDESRREVTQFHFTEWPDFGVPATEEALLSLLVCARAEAPEHAKIVVHCSAGVGRTGTFIALWNLQESYEQGQMIDIDETILKLREDRGYMVQSQEQYLYVFKCFARYLESPRAYAAEGIRNRGYNETEHSNRGLGHSSENVAGNLASSVSVRSQENRGRQQQALRPEPLVAPDPDPWAPSDPPRPVPPRPVPPAPKKPPPPLPPAPATDMNLINFGNLPNYSTGQPPPLPPHRPPKPLPQDPGHGYLRQKPSYSEESRPPLPPRPKSSPGFLPVARSHSDQNYNRNVRNNYVDTDV